MASTTRQVDFDRHSRSTAFEQLLLVGTSAGGARAKAIIAWNPRTHEVRSGQEQAGRGFGYWLLKFDGVRHNGDKELDDPRGFGALEYAYYLMEISCGVQMSECRLMVEGPRRHFMTRRFDRLADGDKLHMQTLAGLAHLDFNDAGAHSYEQALRLCRRLSMNRATIEQLFRRMVFNIVARNQDDHVKNIAFLMDRQGRWTLSPAYDVTFSYNPAGAWTARHQMTLNGKREAFDRDDFRQCAKGVSMKRGRADVIIDEVVATVRDWPRFAAEAEIDAAWVAEVGALQRCDL